MDEKARKYLSRVNPCEAAQQLAPEDINALEDHGGLSDPQRKRYDALRWGDWILGQPTASASTQGVERQGVVADMSAITDKGAAR